LNDKNDGDGQTPLDTDYLRKMARKTDAGLRVVSGKDYFCSIPWAWNHQAAHFGSSFIDGPSIGRCKHERQIDVFNPAQRPIWTSIAMP